MDRIESIIEHIKEQGVLPLFYHEDKQVCLDVIKALYEAGIRVIEFTNRGEHALENFKAIQALRDETMQDLLLAIGTIRNADQATTYIKAGADILISPVFDPDVADEAYLAKILWIPGCMTPTEIHVAQNAGCRLVKLFPGNVLGPAFVTGIRELFPGMDFMPTGGVELNEESMGEWFRAGVCAVGLGSKVISRSLLEQKDYATITRLASEAISIVQSINK